MPLPYWIMNTGSNKYIWTKVTIPAKKSITLHIRKKEGYSPNPEQVFIGVIDGLVGCWHFDEGSGNTVYDSSGNNNHGTIHGATWTDNGYYGKALEFDGVDDWVKITGLSGKIFTIAVLGRYTVKPSDLQSGNFWHYILRAGGSCHIETGHYSNNSQHLLKLKYSDGTTRQCGKTDNDTDWHFWTYRVVNKQYMRLDIVDKDVYTQRSLDPNKDILGLDTIGIGGYNGNECSPLIIDEVMIFNRALTDEEVKLLYNNHGIGGYDGKCYIKQKPVGREPQITVKQTNNEWKIIIYNPNDKHLIDYQVKIPADNIITSVNESLEITTNNVYGYWIDDHLNVWTMISVRPTETLTFYIKPDNNCVPEPWIFDYLKTSIDPSKWEVNCEFVPDIDGVTITKGYIKANTNVDNKVVDLVFDPKYTVGKKPLISLANKIYVEYNNGKLDFYLDYSSNPQSITTTYQLNFGKIKTINGWKNLIPGILKLRYKGKSGHPSNHEGLINDYDYSALYVKEIVDSIYHPSSDKYGYQNELYVCILDVQKQQKINFGIDGDDAVEYEIINLNNPNERIVKGWYDKHGFKNKPQAISNITLKPSKYLIIVRQEEDHGGEGVIFYWKYQNEPNWRVFSVDNAPGTVYTWIPTDNEAKTKEFIEKARVDLEKPRIFVKPNTYQRLIIDLSEGIKLSVNTNKIYANYAKNYNNVNSIVLGDTNGGKVNIKYCNVKVYPKFYYSTKSILKFF